MSGAFSLLVLAVYYVILGSSRLLPLQLPANATFSTDAVPVKYACVCTLVLSNVDQRALVDPAIQDNLCSQGSESDFATPLHSP